MKAFQVRVERIQTWVIRIEAESENEAKRQATHAAICDGTGHRTTEINAHASPCPTLADMVPGAHVRFG